MENRIKVQRDTIEIFDRRWYINAKEELVSINDADITASIKGTKRYYKDDLVKRYHNGSLMRYIENDTFIVQEDCLEVGMFFQSLGYNPVVLNMANAVNPGGGYKNGESAQEESLFRRTNLHLCLDSQRTRLYPIPKRGALYTSNAIVIKHSEFEDYRPLEKPMQVCFISAAAHRCGKDDTIDVDGTKILTEDIEILTKNKIDSIFEVAAIERHNVLILSAFGCGAFNNPPRCIAKLFKDALNKYKKHFRYIIFAIFDDKNALANNKDGNVKVFSEILGLPVLTYVNLVANVCK